MIKDSVANTCSCHGSCVYFVHPSTDSVEISTETRPICRSIYRPKLDRYVGRYIDRNSTDMSVEISTDTRPICRSTYRPTYRPTYLSRYIGRVSVDMSTDISIEYRSICRPMYRSRGAQNTHDPYRCGL